MSQILIERAGAVKPDGDDQLVVRLKQGDVAALDRIVERFWVAILRYTLKLLGDRDAAEDAVQETFLRLWNERATLRTLSVRSYLYRVARNVAFDELRKRRVRVRWLTGELAQQAAAREEPEVAGGQTELYDAVRVAINTLPTRRREAFTLVYLHDLSYRQVAEIMRISPETVKKQITLALADLRTLMKSRL
jgi:RNA polymerase sigma-70 factor (ECF subfamily)